MARKRGLVSWGLVIAPGSAASTSRITLPTRHLATAAVVTGARPLERALGPDLDRGAENARRAEQLAVLKTFAEGELLRRLPFRNLVGGSLSFPAETKLPRVGFRAVNEGYRQSYGVINSDSEFVHLVHHLAEDHRPCCRQRPPCPPQVQGARVPMADALLPRRCRIDRLQRDGDLDQLRSQRCGV
jgi:hypothetical protein